MYFLYDTHHSTVLSTFSYIYRLKIKMKMCQFRTISDSSTRSASCPRSFGIRFCCAIPTLTVLLHIFLGFSAENENEDVPIQDYFGFSHALHPLPAVFRNSFLLQRIHDPLALQATHTDAPYKNRRQLLSAAISSAVFIAYMSLTSSET